MTVRQPRPGVAAQVWWEGRKLLYIAPEGEAKPPPDGAMLAGYALPPEPQLAGIVRVMARIAAREWLADQRRG